MSQRAGLSPLELLYGKDRVTVATALAADFLAKRRLIHGDLEMRLQSDQDQNQDDDDEDDEDGQDSGSAGGAGGDSSSKDKDKGSNPDAKISALQEEKDRHFRARQEAEQERDRLKAEAEERQRAENDEVTNLKNDVEKYKTEAAALREQLDNALLDNAFLTDNSFEWHNPKMVLRNIDRSDVSIDKDGSVSGVAEAIKKLAEENPWMLKSKSKKDSGKDEDDDSEDDKQGSPSGSQRNGKKKGSATKYKESDLRSRYPALRR